MVPLLTSSALTCASVLLASAAMSASDGFTALLRAITNASVTLGFFTAALARVVLSVRICAGRYAAVLPRPVVWISSAASAG